MTNSMFRLEHVREKPWCEKVMGGSYGPHQTLSRKGAWLQTVERTS